MINLAAIKPYWKNPRKISDAAVDAVAESIRRYGFNVPLVLDRDLTIISGHTRYRALKKLGATEAACVILDLDPRKAQEYRLVDNKVHEMTSWDFDALAVELRELDWKGMELYFPDVDKLVDISVGLPKTATGGIEDYGIRFSRDGQEERDPANIQKRNEKDIGSYIEVMCPECGAVFAVTRDEIERELKTAARQAE